MKGIKYRVTNTTIKPVRHDEDGIDTRTMTEKVGHNVQFRTERDRLIWLTPRGNSAKAILGSIDEGLIKLQMGGFIEIEEVKDITAVLREHTLGKTAPLDKDVAKAKIKRERKKRPNKIKTTEMGKDSHEQKGGIEHDSALNPDGEPNFVVKVGGNNKKKRRGRGSRAVDGS